jgi:hypothetical protein
MMSMNADAIAPGVLDVDNHGIRVTARAGDGGGHAAGRHQGRLVAP